MHFCIRRMNWQENSLFACVCLCVWACYRCSSRSWVLDNCRTAWNETNDRSNRTKYRMTYISEQMHVLIFVRYYIHFPLILHCLILFHTLYSWNCSFFLPSLLIVFIRTHVSAIVQYVGLRIKTFNFVSPPCHAYGLPRKQEKSARQ